MEDNSTKQKPTKEGGYPVLIYMGMLVKVDEDLYLGLFKHPGIIEKFFKLDIDAGFSPNISDNRIVVVQANVYKKRDETKANIKVKEQLGLEVNKSLKETFDKGIIEKLCNHVYFDVIAHIIANKKNMDPIFIKLLEDAKYI